MGGEWGNKKLERKERGEMNRSHLTLEGGRP